MEAKGYQFLTELEEMNGLDFEVQPIDLIHDVKVLLKEYYVATFSEHGDTLNIRFNNGQRFYLTIGEIK